MEKTTRQLLYQIHRSHLAELKLEEKGGLTSKEVVKKKELQSKQKTYREELVKLVGMDDVTLEQLPQLHARLKELGVPEDELHDNAWLLGDGSWC